MSLDTAYFIYFAIHVPLTLLIDDTFLIPQKYQLSVQKELYKYQVTHNKDFLAAELPIWMKYFVAVELIFQLPVFITCIISYLKSGPQKRISRCLYPFMLMYGFNAAFTSLQCLIYIYVQASSYELSTSEAYKLLGLYTPTFLIPFFMCADITSRLIKMSGNCKKEKVN